MIHAIALRDLFPAGSLFLDCWEGSSRFRSLVPRWFRDPGAFAEQRDALVGRAYDRKAVASILQEQNLLFGAGSAVMANIQRLADPRSLVVIGGQQAGLFGGPLYTVHKALTILSLAERMESHLGQPVIPVFWIASEDSDLAEVDKAVVADSDGRLRELRLAGDETAKVPVSLVKLGSGLPPLLDELAEVLPQTEFASDILESLRLSYSPEKAYPQAFGAWMAALFSGRGLVIIDPSDVRLKRIAMPLFQKEVAGKSPVSRAVIEQTKLLSGAGYAPQIELREGMLTLFHQAPAREAIAIQDRGFTLRSAGRAFSNGDLEALLAEKPEQFTPNAVLRPLYQDSLFPTLAVVLGPSEIAYFCQLPLAYQGMNIPMPVIFPRSSLTLVEPRVQRLLSKFDLSLAAVLSRGERIIDDIVRKGIPPALLDQLSSGREQAVGTWDSLSQSIHRLDPTLDRTAQIAAGRTLRQFEFMEKKILQAARRKEETLRAQTRRLAAALAPRGGLQERTLTALPFLARYGRPVLGQAAAAIDPFAPEHRGVVIDG
ncbi:MAG TPA: bacillithiol biosynthesis cysteine-adding enzyme BshC [Spirochaetia bacterium]|nr:bacillithiol biosynthesis cysteine-adding enzyme BshC [Spirochaetia bacterium]